MIFVTVGQDKRLASAARILKETGHTVLPYAGERIADHTTAVLCPIPVTRDGLHIYGSDWDLAALFGHVPAGVPILGGAYDGKTVDVTAREDFALLGAVPTAEGAIALAIEQTETTLFDSRILVTGYGRVARILLDRLRVFSPRITVTARRQEALAEAQAHGFSAVPLTELPSLVSDADLVFNTVPAPIFNEKTLANANVSTVFVELASRDAGFDDFVKSRIRLISAPGLPGRYSPESAGRILAQTVLNVLQKDSPKGE